MTIFIVGGRRRRLLSPLPLSSLLPQSGKWMDDGHVRVRPVGTRTMNADVGCVIREETLPSSTFPPREGGLSRSLVK